ncbi:hypothetical protein [Burkholderia vietnamiensis]|uniref:hypothetical protein n=1 Tax=Burkholderia vietnamiensis TaxID=60552 RepID=UPI001589D6D0|nr:hypothetical protein [Burkholderia vietnamiensis]
MDKINDGGPAFPGPDQAEQSVDIHEGMTLRDHFAAKALPAIYDRVQSGGFDRVATLAYEMADAMLRARGEA